MNTALTGYQAILDRHARPRFTDTDLTSRIEDAERLLRSCRLCAHECRVDRLAGETGVCEVDDQLHLASAFEHYGEEPFLVPSFTLFLASCNFACRYCQNADISDPAGVSSTPVTTSAELARLIDAHGHCRNVNFVGGEPTPYLPFILRSLAEVTVDIPVIWNSNFYMSEEAMDLLSHTVDLYLSDFKYGNDDCALRLSNAADYSAVVRRNHLSAFDDADLLIRHLVLPGHFDCCTRPIHEFIAEHFEDRAVVNLMDQYRPTHRAGEYPEINRRLSYEEFRVAVDLAEALDLNFIT
jgi:putative pyruvate formate lyase activating enzyme